MFDSRQSEDSEQDHVDPDLLESEPDEDIDDEEGTRVWCSHCGSHQVRESSRRHGVDWLLMLGFMRTFRCHSCYRRFHQFVAPGTVIQQPWRPEESHRHSRNQPE